MKGDELDQRIPGRRGTNPRPSWPTHRAKARAARKRARTRAPAKVQRHEHRQS